MEIPTRVEGRRGCGYRQGGGLYLMSPPASEPCPLLPVELSVCPTCGEGVKPARSWTWVDADKLLGLPLDHPTGEAAHALACPLSHLLGRSGLLWIGEGFYATPRVFMEEAMSMGVSRRITHVPTDFKVGETWVLLAHRKALQGACTECPCLAYSEGEDGCFCGHELEDHAGRPGVFTLFRPTAVEYVVRGDESEEELERLVKRGVQPVRVERAEEEFDLQDALNPPGTAPAAPQPKGSTMSDQTTPTKAGLDKTVRNALRGTKIDELDANQLERAQNPQPGISGKALKGWILTGEQPAEDTRTAAEKLAANGSGTATGSKGGRRRAEAPREGSAVAVAIEILTEAKANGEDSLSAKQIFERGQEQGRFGMLAGKNPADTLSSALYSVLGRYLERPARGQYAVLEQPQKD